MEDIQVPIRQQRSWVGGQQRPSSAPPSPRARQVVRARGKVIRSPDRHGERLGQYDVRAKLLGNLEFLLALRRGERPFPYCVSIHLINRCNHRCNFCEAGTYLQTNRQHLPTERVERLLDSLKNQGVRSIIWSGGGEPLLHPDLVPLVQRAHALGFSNGMITNFSAPLTKRAGKMEALLGALSWLRISCNGGDRPTYRRIHGRDDFARVLENLGGAATSLARGQTHCQLSFSMVYKPDNVDSIPSLVREAVNLRIIRSVHLRPDQFLPDPGWLQSPQVTAILREARRIAWSSSNMTITTSEYLEQQYPSAFPPRCLAHFVACTVLASGAVSFCRSRFDTPETHLGNIHEQSIEQIWQSERARRLEATLKPRDCAGFCRQMHVNVHADALCRTPPELDTDFI